MQIIKNINNNYAVAIDGAGKQLVISGKGVGFGCVPRELKDISVINKSYYGVDEAYVSMLNELPEEIIEISSRIVDRARLLIDADISSNVVFALADHIHFCLQRYQKKITVKLPIAYDIQQLFEKEMEIGEYGVKLIRDKFRVHLPREEAVCIALHIINAENLQKNKAIIDNDKIVDDITKIVEKKFSLHIDKNGFSYARFVTHMHYLLKRGKSKHLLDSADCTAYDTMKKEYQKTWECVEMINKYLKRTLKLTLTDEEKLYLILHIVRLCTYEDCNQ